MPSADYVLCDVFTDQPLAGNQLAVFPAAQAIPERDLQRVAREFNFSEVTFVVPPGDDDADARIRIFTPQAELPFAGHPTLGTAVVLGATRGANTVRLETGLGVVPVALEATGGAAARGWMRQPVPEVRLFAEVDELIEALGIEGSLIPVELYDNGVLHVFVALANDDAVAAVDVDARRLPRRDVGTNCFAGTGTHWKTRCFFHGLPSGEDPATGSAAGPLLYHLLRHRTVDRGVEIEIAQGVELARPSTLYARTSPGDDPLDAIDVGGDVVVLGGGTLTW